MSRMLPLDNEAGPNPSKDQHFLNDPQLLDLMLSLAQPQKEDVVLEIGAGTGMITEKLAERVKLVYAVEKDQRFGPELSSLSTRFKNVNVIFGDALRIVFPKFDKIVSNMPYAIIEAMIQRFVRTKFVKAIIITPWSFAQRISAQIGEPLYSRLSLEFNTFFVLDYVKITKPDSFFPPPRTNAALIRFSPKNPSKPEEFLWQQILLRRDMKTKNATRESLVKTYEVKFGQKLTKNNARVMLKDVVSNKLANRKISMLSAEELESFLSKFKLERI